MSKNINFAKVLLKITAIKGQTIENELKLLFYLVLEEFNEFNKPKLIIKLTK